MEPCHWKIKWKNDGKTKNGEDSERRVLIFSLYVARWRKQYYKKWKDFLPKNKSVTSHIISENFWCAEYRQQWLAVFYWEISLGEKQNKTKEHW